MILAVLLFFFPLSAEEGSAEKESRIQEIKEKIAEEKETQEEKSEEKEEEKEKEKEKDKHKKKSKDRDDSDSDFFYWMFRSLYDGFFDFLTNVRYTDYPYARGSDFKFCASINRDPSLTKIAFLHSSVEASYLGKDIGDNYGVTAKVYGNFFSLHLNYFYQRIFSSEESLTLHSINGGISFALHSFMLTPFLGAFYIETLEGAQFSLGANLQIFLPANFIMDLYTLNSSYGSLNFNNFSASLNYAFSRINIGFGYNYNHYGKPVFSGPLVKISFWL